MTNVIQLPLSHFDEFQDFIVDMRDFLEEEMREADQARTLKLAGVKDKVDHAWDLLDDWAEVESSQELEEVISAHEQIHAGVEQRLDEARALIAELQEIFDEIVLKKEEE